MKTKKIAAVLLTFIMAIGLMAGCGASNTNQSASNNSLLLIMIAILQVQTSLEMKKRIQIPKTPQIQQKIHQQEMEKHWLYIIQLQEIQKMLLKR